MRPAVKADGTFEWPQLELKTVGSLRGLYARASLPVGTCIPIFGLRLSEAQFEQYHDGDVMPYVRYIVRKRSSKYHVLLLDSSNQFYLGRSIIGAINEPQDRKKPNCVWKGDFVVVAQRIQPGDQLTISYGPAYVRDYPVNRWVTKKCEYPELSRFPRVPPRPLPDLWDAVGTPSEWSDDHDEVSSEGTLVDELQQY